MPTRDRRRPASTPAVTPTSITRCAIYLRISLDRTGEQLAVSRQRDACREIATQRGWTVVAEFVDNDVSASDKRTDRPGYNDLLRAYEAGSFEALVCWDLDRLTRQPRQLEDWIDAAQERGLRLVTANGEADLTTDGGRMFARIKASVARGEIERKSARQRQATEQRATLGRPMWVRRPFGYERDGTLRESEAALIRQAYADLLNGRSLTAICRDFEASGIPTTIGRERWGHATVRTILKSPRNAALSTYYGEIVGDATWSPIVDEATWRAADRLLDDPARHKGQGPLANLLSGIAQCAVCDATVKVAWRGRKGQEDAYAIYTCKSGGHVSLPVDFADSRVLIELTRRADEIDRTQLVTEDPPDTAPLRVEAAALADKLATLGEDYAADRIDRATMIAASARLREQVERVEGEIAAAGRRVVWEYVDLEHLFEEFDDLALERQREVIRDAYASIRMRPRGRGRIAPRAEHIDLKFSPEWEITR